MSALSDSAIDIADYRIYDEKLTALREKYSHYSSKTKIKQQILSDYICDYLAGGSCTASVLSEITGIEPSAISKYKNGDHAPRSKETAIALALGMELSEEDRYVLINALGHEYPQDKRDFCIELAARKGSYNGSEIIELIDGMFPKKRCITTQPGTAAQHYGGKIHNENSIDSRAEPQGQFLPYRAYDCRKNKGRKGNNRVLSA